ncbi:hypothetical protein BHE74_00026184 [Ensete ventricosum]|nr:hypothetical protein GW17_00040696 [Ensete ventricosum]RWW66464.1 hypothetical protein BHE74_00026184 [Ensete ventricosum]RZS08689.1 hypothetical protein BHM03_00039696 [Ensete ventricosum]
MGLRLDVHEFPSLSLVHTTGSKSNNSDEVECSTPKSEELEPRPATLCPAAPRKPRPAKRKLRPPPKGYHQVPSDLASVFVPLPCPGSKKIRVA